MANRIIPDPKKETDGATTLGWRFLFELCTSADATDAAAAETADGAITEFTAPHGNFIKSDGNAAEASDVTAKVDGGAATVSSIDAATGKATLSAAPAADAAVTLTYKHVDKCHHAEVYIKAEDMTDSEDAAEAKNLAVTEATSRRTSWTAALAAESSKTDQPSLSGDVTL